MIVPIDVVPKGEKGEIRTHRPSYASLGKRFPEPRRIPARSLLLNLSGERSGLL
jgi:hypothetical protein